MDAFEALRQRDIEALKQALQADPAGAIAAGPDGASLLSTAAYMGNKDAIAAIRAALPELTPFEAIITGDEAELRRALDGGWDANTTAPDGFAPLALAAFFGHETLFDLLLPLTTNVNERAKNAQHVASLHAATAVRKPAMVEKLLRAGADPNLPQQEGIRPLHVAAQRGDAVIAGLLILFGASLTLKSARGQSAADFARAGGHEWLVERLDALVHTP